MKSTAQNTAPTTIARHWIGGSYATGTAARTADVFDPAEGCVTCRVQLASAQEADAAVQAAKGAFPGWAKTPAVKRAAVLFRFRELLERHKQELAQIITREHGKVLSDAAGSLQRGMEVVDFACGIPALLKGEYSQNVGRGVDCYTVAEPLGVCAGITPFNFPAMVPMWMFPLAIACGNAFVLKPSERDPSCSLRMAELWTEAGLPDGVFNVLNGDKIAVDCLLGHPDVAAVSFVGSTPVAEHVYRRGTAAGKRVQALGGAKNHMVVLPDADMQGAADAVVGAAYGSAGERCMAISVVVAVADAGDRLSTALLPKIDALKIGSGQDPASEMGPLISNAHRDKVTGYIESGINEGAKLLIDGRAHVSVSQNRGFFLGPSLFDHVDPAMKIYREEIFGPVLCIVRVDTPDEALELVNRHEYGNGTAIFTCNGRAAREFVGNVKAGMVGVNVPIPVPMAFHSFGGWKRSMFGDSNVHGAEGVRFYTKTKTVTSRWPDDQSLGAELDMPTAK